MMKRRIPLLLLLLFLTNRSLAQKTPAQERAILLELYEATEGPSWTHQEGWQEAATSDASQVVSNHCDWYGVSCHPVSGQVMALELSETNVVRRIPPTLYTLPALERLDFYDNPLEDAGLVGLLQYDQTSPLQAIDFSSCLLQHVEGISGAAATLKEVRLSNNQLRQGFPLELTNLTAMEDLYLSANPGIGTLPNELAQLSLHLSRLHVNQAGVTGTLPTVLGRLNRLFVLNLGDNALTGTIPTELEQMVNLETLHLQREVSSTQDVGMKNATDRLTGPVPSFYQLPFLDSLLLGNQALTGSLPDNFLAARDADQPVRVALQNNLLTGSLPASLLRFDELSLEITGNALTDLDSQVCSKYGWMNGLVEFFGCAAVACPPGTYNAAGQQTSASLPCVACDSSDRESDDNGLGDPATWWGRTSCPSDATGAGEAPVRPVTSILADLYRALQGDRWDVRDGWADMADLLDPTLDLAPDASPFVSGTDLRVLAGYCDWHGIICDAATGEVQILTLASNSLAGTLPASIWQLPGLQSLDLSYNAIEPDPQAGFWGIQQATSLTRLRLSHTDLKSTLHLDQAQGGALRELYLDGCRFNGPFPTELLALTALESLHMEASFLTGILPNELRKMSQLERLYLHENRLSGPLPDALVDLQELQVLDLSDNDFSGVVPASYNNFAHLLSLRINSARGGLGGALPSFAGLRRIEELELAFNLFQGSIPDDFLANRPADSTSDTDQLKVRLTGNLLTGALPSRLAAYPRVILELEDNLITEMDNAFCSKAAWMDGDVGLVGCDAILCPAGQWSPHGRAIDRLGVSCEPCAGNLYYGETACETAGGLEENREVQILNLLYSATGGPYWNASHANWTKPGVPICYREGVICGWPGDDFNSGVTELRMNHFGLRGELPTELFELPTIRHLAFSSNPVNMVFTGIEQADILEVIRLTETDVRSFDGIENAGDKMWELHASDNGIDGPFPEALLRSTSLRALFLQGNDFTGTVPTELGLLSTLTTLIVEGSNFVGPLPTEVGQLSLLERLDFRANSLSGVLPTELGQLDLLSSLDLSDQESDKKLTGSLFAFDTNPALTQLDLRRNNFVGALPSNLLAAADRAAEMRVDFSFNALTGAVPTELGTFENLEIDLVGNEVDELAPELCTKVDWMSGDVGLVTDEARRCDAILCPPGTYSPAGRIQEGSGSCEPCASANQAPFFGTVSCDTVASEDERAILMRFYYATAGGSWVDSEGWMTQDPICSWHGVVCNTRQSVEELNLEDNGLENANAEVDVFALVTSLPNLKVLDLKGNSIHLEIQSVSPTSALETLSLSSTGLTSLEGISRIAGLKVLHATYNSLNGTFPEEIFDMSTLRELYLSFNKISGTIPAAIASLENLEMLYVFNNELSGEIPSEVGNMPNMRELFLARNFLHGSIPDTFDQMPSLEQLLLYDQQGAEPLSGPLPSFTQSSSLRYLDLSNNALSGAIPDTFLSGVTETDEPISVILQNNDLSGPIPVSLDRFPRLDIELADNQITGIPNEVCSNGGWMDGNVATINGCDAILCPPGTYNEFGRQVSKDLACVSCSALASSNVFGQTRCVDVESEIDILNLIYDSAGGEFWFNSTNWKSEFPICSWHGIQCDSGQQAIDGIVEIDLANNNLTGRLPTEVWSLPSLRSITLRENFQLRVSIDTIELAAATLEVLDVYRTRLDNLDALPGASRLKELYISDFVGTFPQEIFSLASTLETLYIPWNFFIGTIPTRIGELSHLKRLYASGNDFHGAVPSEIGRLTGLEDLLLDENLLSGSLPEEVTSMRSLKNFIVSRKSKGGRKLSGPLPSFSHLPELMSLKLDGNALTGSIPPDFVSSSLSLSVVDLSNNLLTGALPEELDSLSGLTIVLTENRISGIPEALCDNEHWMGHAVEQFGCDAILCPPQTVNPIGRAISEDGCLPCEEGSSPYFGGTTCLLEIDERAILMDIYDATGGEGWHRSDFWGSLVDVCDWYGVGCENGHVVLLNLQSNNLVGTLPPVVWDLPRLRSLWLSLNDGLSMNFEGSANARDLLELRLDGTGISSVDGIRDLEMLVELDVSFNRFEGTFPDEILELENLRVLRANQNSFSGELPDLLSRLRLLRVLQLHDNAFSGKLPSFDQMVPLLEIDLSYNELTGTIPFNFLAHVPEFSPVSVMLRGNKLDGAIPVELARFDAMNLVLTDNMIDHVPHEFCDKTRWNDGKVGLFGCGAILCPPGTSNADGRQTADYRTCVSCNKADDELFGQVDCPGERTIATSSARGSVQLSIIGILSMATVLLLIC